MQRAQPITDEALVNLKELIRVNLDSAAEFRAAAKQIRSAGIATVLQEIAQEHDNHAMELQRLLEVLPKEIPDSDVITGILPALQPATAGQRNGGGDHMVLAGAEHREDAIRQRYESILPQVAGNAINEFLRRQYLEIKRGQESIRGLRDAGDAAFRGHEA